MSSFRKEESPPCSNQQIIMNKNEPIESANISSCHPRVLIMNPISNLSFILTQLWVEPVRRLENFPIAPKIRLVGSKIHFWLSYMHHTTAKLYL
jgi:hypothetical protein